MVSTKSRVITTESIFEEFRKHYLKLISLFSHLRNENFYSELMFNTFNLVGNKLIAFLDDLIISKQVHYGVFMNAFSSTLHSSNFLKDCEMKNCERAYKSISYDLVRNIIDVAMLEIEKVIQNSSNNKIDPSTYDKQLLLVVAYGIYFFIVFKNEKLD